MKVHLGRGSDHACNSSFALGACGGGSGNVLHYFVICCEAWHAAGDVLLRQASMTANARRRSSVPGRLAEVDAQRSGGFGMLRRNSLAPLSQSQPLQRGGLLDEDEMFEDIEGGKEARGGKYACYCTCASRKASLCTVWSMCCAMHVLPVILSHHRCRCRLPP